MKRSPAGGCSRLQWGCVYSAVFFSFFRAKLNQVRLLCSTKYRVTRVCFISGEKRDMKIISSEQLCSLPFSSSDVAVFLVIFFSLNFHLLWIASTIPLPPPPILFSFGLAFHHFCALIWERKNKKHFAVSTATEVPLAYISIRNLPIHSQTFIYICFFQVLFRPLLLVGWDLSERCTTTSTFYSECNTHWMERGKIFSMSVCVRMRSSVFNIFFLRSWRPNHFFFNFGGEVVNPSGFLQLFFLRQNCLNLRKKYFAAKKSHRKIQKSFFVFLIFFFVFF